MKLVSINIEGDKHWDRVLSFLEQEKPDVLCIQEVFEDDLEKVPNYPQLLFQPDIKKSHTRGGDPVRFGIATFSKLPFLTEHLPYYVTNTPELPLQDTTNEQTIHDTYRRGYIRVDVEHDDAVYRIINTHFTWTPQGEAAPYQAEDLEALRALLKDEDEHVLCGDFNIPRRINPLWARLVEGHTDWIPETVGSSIDLSLHRHKDNPEIAGRLSAYVVDYLLSTPRYRATDVTLKSGVSDHKVIVATILPAE